MAAEPKKIKGDLRIDGEVSIPNESQNRATVIDGSGKLKSSSITSTELGYLSGVTSSVQTQITDAQDDATQALSDAGDAQTDIDNHLSDTADAHDASAISNVPSGNLAATDLQGAVNELQSDIDNRALDSAVIKKDGTVTFTASQSMGGFNLTGLAAPSAPTHAATKEYVDNAVEGARPKEAVRVATTAAIDLSADLEAGDAIDGITLVAGDRVLVKNQADASENGIYVAVASGAASRSTDFDSLSPVDEVNKAYVAVQEGTANAGKIFIQYGAVATLDTDDINFTFFNSITGLVGGDGISVSGSNIEVDHDGAGLTFTAGQLALELDGATLAKSASGLKLSDTAVTPASLGSASETVSLTVDQQGRITAASEQSISIVASQVSDFDEAAQDAIGAALADTSSVDLAYNDGTGEITATVLPAGVDHDGLNNFVANEHIDHSSVSISTAANSGLAGGGDLTSTRSLSIDITNATAETSADNADSILIHDSSANALRKMTRANFLSGVGAATGDIAVTSFAASNNQAVAADVTGLAFANGSVRAFKAYVSVTIDATTPKYETLELLAIQKGADWSLAQEAVGDDSGVTLSITSAGQVQYTSTNNSGFVSCTLKFRALALPV